MSVALYGLIAIFLIRYLRTLDYDRIRDLSISYKWAIVATAVSLAFRYWGVFIWRVILSTLGAVDLPRFTILALVYAKAWLGRYVPGTVTWIAGKVFLASSHGISRRRLLVASVLEGAMHVIAILAISLVFLGIDERLDVVPTPARLTLLALGLALSVVLIPRVFNRLTVLMLRVTRRENLAPGDLTINGRTVANAFGLYGIGYFISGASHFFWARAIYPLGFDDFFFTVAAFNIAGAIGILSIVTPSGLGVREGVLLVLLPVIMPKEAALVLTASSRLWSVVVDLLFVAIAQSFERIRRRDSVGRRA